MNRKNIILGVLIIFFMIQFVPYGHDHNNPKTKSQISWDSNTTKKLFEASCADCHSYNTKWPWYSYVAPVSWMITHHVNEGRENFNISMYNIQKHNKTKDAAHELEENEMPLLGYTLLHKEARLSKENKQKLINGLIKTFGQE